MKKLLTVIQVLAMSVFVGCASSPLEDFADIMTPYEKDKLLCKRVFNSKEEQEAHNKKGYCLSNK